METQADINHELEVMRSGQRITNLRDLELQKENQKNRQAEVYFRQECT